MGLRQGTLASHDAPSLSRKEPPGATTSLGAVALGEAPGPLDDEGHQLAPSAAVTGKAGLGKANTGPPPGSFLGSVDPNEPTYCFCNRVSFGQVSFRPRAFIGLWLRIG